MTPQPIPQAEKILPVGVRPITSKQEEFLKLIRSMIARDHFPPTLEEMAMEAGVTKATAQAYVRRLQAAGCLTHTKGKFRTIRPVDADQ